MKAATLTSPQAVSKRPLRIGQVAQPAPKQGQILLRVRACGVCRTDLHVVEGELPVRRTPVVPGHQIVGEVLACGPDVTGLSAGTRVGVAWLHHTCGACAYCGRGQENLCERADFTGW